MRRAGKSGLLDKSEYSVSFTELQFKIVTIVESRS